MEHFIRGHKPCPITSHFSASEWQWHKERQANACLCWVVVKETLARAPLQVGLTPLLICHVDSEDDNVLYFLLQNRSLNSWSRRGGCLISKCFLHPPPHNTTPPHPATRTPSPTNTQFCLCSSFQSDWCIFHGELFVCLFLSWRNCSELTGSLLATRPCSLPSPFSHSTGAHPHILRTTCFYYINEKILMSEI